MHLVGFEKYTLCYHKCALSFIKIMVLMDTQIFAIAVIAFDKKYEQEKSSNICHMDGFTFTLPPQKNRQSLHCVPYHKQHYGSRMLSFSMSMAVCTILLFIIFASFVSFLFNLFSSQCTEPNTQAVSIEMLN